MEESEIKNESQTEVTTQVDYDNKIKNVKAEFDRKLDNIIAVQQELINAITKSSVNNNGRNEVDDGEIDDLLITNPKKAVSKIKKEMKDEVMKEITSQNQLNQEQSSVLSAIMQDFPELNDPNHEMTRKTVEIYSRMSDKEKALPISYKVAAREAADALSIMPKRYRSADSNDNFTMSSRTAAPRDKKVKVDDSTVALAETLGLNVNDKEVMERISKYAKRDFLKWA